MTEHAAPRPALPATPIIAGVLCNPAGGRIRRQAQLVRASLQSLPGAVYREALTGQEIRDALRQCLDAGVNLLILAGGDGTVHCALSELYRYRPGAAPLLAVIPGGTTNMTALDLGLAGKPLARISLLATALARPDAMGFTTRPALLISHGQELRLAGMFFGCGLIAQGVKYFNCRVRRLGVTHEISGGMVMLAYLLRLLLWPSALPALRLTLGDSGKMHDCLAAFSTTLERLLLGVRPYRCRQQDSLRFTIIDNNMKSVWATLAALLSGNGGRESQDNPDRLELMFDGDFIVDGELYQARHRDGPVIISRSAPLRFLKF